MAGKNIQRRLLAGSLELVQPGLNLVAAGGVAAAAEVTRLWVAGVRGETHTRHRVGAQEEMCGTGGTSDITQQ